MMSSTVRNIRHKAVWGPKRVGSLAAALVFTVASSALAGSPHLHGARGDNRPGAAHDEHQYKLDDEVSDRAKGGNPFSKTPVIVTLQPGKQLPPELKQFVRGESLNIINGQAMVLPDSLLKKLASYPEIFQVHFDRPTRAHNYRTSITVGARAVQQTFNYNGAGVGVAILDSGITTWHDDLTNNYWQSKLSSSSLPYGNQRVTKFVDFVNGLTQPYDDHGHGTHVAGIIAGNGLDSYGQKAGIAPGASIISLKVLDANGQGSISQVIAGLNWVAQNASTYNIRVVNLSVGAMVTESYWTDPLTLAAKKVTDMGITVVTAAGNHGKNALGELQWGGITSPGNAPWVLTVGASSTMGTLTRSDDQMAGYSSSGPTAVDFTAKPDLVAPGTGTISLASPGSTLYNSLTGYLLDGLLSLGTKPYLSLSGTSMAAPVVSGTVALMLQANPSLTPNLIKAILQYTAQPYPGYSPLRQGAGFLDSLGAVTLARFYAKQDGSSLTIPSTWSQNLIWGNYLLSGGTINPQTNAWATNVVWGSALTQGLTGDNVVWGTSCGASTCTTVTPPSGSSSGNLTSTSLIDNIVWGTSLVGDNVVWGTTALDNIVWGTDCGGADCLNVVWGSFDPIDNVVWGTAVLGDNIVWGTAGAIIDNVVWGSMGLDNVVWGTSDVLEPVTFPDDDSEPLPDLGAEFGIDPSLLAPVPATVGGL